MTIAAALARPTVLFTCITLTCILTSVMHNRIPSSSTTNFNTSRALSLLPFIARNEHPLPSIANWNVREFLLSHALNLSAASPAAEVHAPISWISYPFNSSFPTLGVSPNMHMILQSSNIYIRIKGTNERDFNDTAILLLSAHFDSVPTSRGVGDDALGVITLLELARQLIDSPHPLPFTVLINLNNGEELGLYGSHALVHHPLWADVVAFINIDSLCPTGRPMLYRSTSRKLVQLFHQYAPSPHASVLGQELMNGGMIRSDSDFSVYSRNGAAGVDFAFYDRRWVYHTNLDAENLLNPKSVALLGTNLAALLHGIQADDIRQLKDERIGDRNLIYADSFGFSMWVIPYTSMALLTGLLYLAIVLVSTALYPEPIASGPLRATGRMIGLLCVHLLGTFAVVACVLFVQPLAISGRPSLVLVLAILAHLCVPLALVFTVPHSWRVTIPCGTIGAYLVLMPVLALTCIKTAFLIHVVWFALAYLASTVILDCGWVLVNARVIITGVNLSERTSLLRHDDPESGSAPTSSVRSPEWPVWLHSLQFLLASLGPFMVSLDWALMYVNGMAFAVQEGLSIVIVSGFMTLFLFPIGFNLMAVYSLIPANFQKWTLVILSTGIVVLGGVLVSVTPYTQDAPIKLYMQISTNMNAVVSLTDIFQSGQLTPINLVQPTDRVSVMLSNMRGSIDPKSLALGKPVECSTDGDKCTWSAKSMGSNVTWPQVQFHGHKPESAGFVSVVMRMVPSIMDCSVVGIHPVTNALVDMDVDQNGDWWHVHQSSMQPKFRVVVSDPTIPTVQLNLTMPEAWLKQPWSLECRNLMNHGLDASAMALYHTVMRKVPDYVSITSTARGLVFTDYVVHFSPVSEDSGGIVRQVQVSVSRLMEYLNFWAY